MKFVLLIDNTFSDKTFIEQVEQKLSSVADECSHVSLHTYILHEGKALDSDTELLITMLLNEPERTPVILDAKCAKYYPEILKLQSSIVMFEHEENLSADINEYNVFNSKIAISHGARVDYINQNFHDTDNDKQLNVVDIVKYIATHEYYVYLAKVFYHEHNKFPILILPRYCQLECKTVEDIQKKFEIRQFYKDKANWTTTEIGCEFNEDDVLNTCVDIAIHSLSDTRLSQMNRSQLQYKKV